MMKSLIGGIRDAATRAPAANVPSVNGLQMLTRPKGGMEQELRMMGGVGTLYQIVSTLAGSVSLAPWCLCRKPGPRSDMQAPRQEVMRHPALVVWNNPNPFFTRQELIESVQQHVELVGEGYLLVLRNDSFSMPMELWPVRPDRMIPVPDAQQYLAGWIYRGPNGEKIPLGLDEVIQIRVPNPIDPYRGLGPVQTILADLESARLSAEWNRNFFLNGAQPGGIIEVSEELDDLAFDRLQRQWNEQHRGVPNAHRVGILENGAKWVDRSISHDDMQFSQLRKVSQDVIREAFGIAKTMLGQTEDVNRASAEAAAMVFRRDKRLPRLERWKQALNTKFLPLFGSSGTGVEFEFDPEIPEDEVSEAAERKSKTEGAAALVTAGWHPDDVLMSMDLPPMRFVGPPATSKPADKPQKAAEESMPMEGED